MNASFSYKGTIIGFIVSVVVIIVALSVSVVAWVNPNQPEKLFYNDQSWAYPASLDALANGCGQTFFIPPVEGQFGLIPDEYWELNANPADNIPKGPQVVPVYGYLANEGLNDTDIRFWSTQEATDNGPLNQQTVLRTMYDKDILVIWYRADLATIDIAALQEYANAHYGKVLVYPWMYNNGVILGDRKVAFSSWGISQTCNLYSETVLDDFVKFKEQNPIERVDPIPMGGMTETGVLYPLGVLPKVANNDGE